MSDQTVKYIVSADVAGMRPLYDMLFKINTEVRTLAANLKSLSGGPGSHISQSASSGGQAAVARSSPTSGPGIDGFREVTRAIGYGNKLLERIAASIERSLGRAQFERSGGAGWQPVTNGMRGGGLGGGGGPRVGSIISPKGLVGGAALSHAFMAAGSGLESRLKDSRGHDTQASASVGAGMSIGAGAAAGSVAGPFGALVGGLSAAVGQSDKLATAITGISAAAEEAKQKLGSLAPAMLNSMDKAGSENIRGRARYAASLENGLSGLSSPDERIQSIQANRAKAQSRIGDIEGSYTNRFGGNAENLFGGMGENKHAPGSGAWLAQKLGDERKQQDSMMPQSPGKLGELGESTKEVEGLQRNITAGLREELDLRKAALDTEKQIADTAINSLNRRKSGLYELLEAERNRTKEGFGELSKTQQRRAGRIATKLDSGGKLTRSELNTIRGNSLFEKDVAKINKEKADEGGFSDNAAIQRRAKDREGSVQAQIAIIDEALAKTVHPLKVDLQIEEQSLKKLEESLKNTATPALQKAVEQSGLVESRQFEANAARANAAGGGR